MHYVATVKLEQDSYSMSFNTEKQAQDWLDSQNNNLNYKTIITKYDKNWKEIESIEYTKGE